MKYEKKAGPLSFDDYLGVNCFSYLCSVRHVHKNRVAARRETCIGFKQRDHLPHAYAFDNYGCYSFSLVEKRKAKFRRTTISVSVVLSF